MSSSSSSSSTGAPTPSSSSSSDAALHTALMAEIRAGTNGLTSAWDSPAKALQSLTQALVEMSQGEAKEYLEYTLSTEKIDAFNKTINAAYDAGCEAYQVATDTIALAKAIANYGPTPGNVNQLKLLITDRYDQLVTKLRSIVLKLGNLGQELKSAGDSKWNKFSYFIYKTRYTILGLSVATGLAVTVIGLPVAVEATTIAIYAFIGAANGLAAVANAMKDLPTLNGELERIQDLASEAHAKASETLKRAMEAWAPGKIAMGDATGQSSAEKANFLYNVASMADEADKLKAAADKLMHAASSLPGLDKSNISWLWQISCSVM